MDKLEKFSLGNFSKMFLCTLRETEGWGDMESRVIRFTSIPLMRKRKMRRDLPEDVGEDHQLMSFSEALSWGGR